MTPGIPELPLFLGAFSVYANSVLRVEGLRPLQHVSGMDSEYMLISRGLKEPYQRLERLPCVWHP